jgi:putative ABC transport system permease protein
MRIPIVDGRGIEATDRAGGQGAVVISRRMADLFWPNEPAVGRPIRISGFGDGIVVGVVANVRSQTLSQQAQPEMYVPQAQTTARTITYVIKSPLATAQMLSAARDVVRRFDSRVPLISPGSMTQVVDEQLARPRFYLLLIGLFAVLAVVLAAVGMYGVVAYVVSQRTREIGVRMALGASRSSVVQMVLWQGFKPAIAGIVAGVAISFVVIRLIQQLLYEVRPHDPATLAGVSALLVVVVLLACAIPARRATAVPPADALRSE